MSELKGGARPSSKRKTEKEKAVAAMSELDTVESQRLSVDIPKELHKKIKGFCAMNDLAMNELVEDLLLKHLKENK